MRQNRRQFLLQSARAATTLCAFSTNHRGVAAASPRRPRLQVDVHCHTFNGTDISVNGFLRDVELENTFHVEAASARFIADRLTPILLRDAKTGAQELDYLAKAKVSRNAVGLFVQPPSAGLDRSTRTRVPSDEEAERILNDALRTEDHSTALRLNTLGPDLQWYTYAKRYLQWMYLLKDYRAQLTQDLINNNPDVDLFVPCLVDFATPLGHDEPTTPRSVQIEVFGKLVAHFKGRVHPFVAYDPIRVATAPDPKAAFEAERKMLTRALEVGFIGVKIYPPMGFRPLANEDHAGVSGQKLDDALRWLYQWCVDNDVPITAHCNNSNGAARNFGEYASPDGWRPVFTAGNYPALRVNLGHLGGDAALVSDQDITSTWAWQAANLMTDFPTSRIFADLSYHANVLEDDGFRHKYLWRLGSIVAQFPVMADRIMYGSDWVMLALEFHAADYHRRYCSAMQQVLPRLFAGFAGENAGNFLGFRNTAAGPDGNRRRLEALYRTGAPHWLAALD